MARVMNSLPRGSRQGRFLRGNVRNHEASTNPRSGAWPHWQRLFLPLAAAGLWGLAGSVLAVDTHDTRMLSGPAVSARHVAFLYAGDLWAANLDGSGVRRLTSHPGVESNPRFSPDGTLIAFSAQYDGNTDVYVVPVEGGEPKRLTYHPSEDLVQSFTPDGKAVLFTSPREVYTRRHAQLFTALLAGGMPEKLPIPHAFKASYSPDGSRIAYVPLYEAFRQWKHYRGGTASRIWLYDVKTHAVEQIPQPAGRCNDTDPMWIGSAVYFRSDRNGEFNLFAYDLGSKTVEQLTQHRSFPVLSASAGGGRIIYEHAGDLHLYDIGLRTTTRLVMGVAADLIEARPRFASGSKWVRETALSPSGARVAFDFRGEIVTVPAEKGDPRNLTQSPAIHDRAPAWSPDGTRIAWFSDAGGEYALRVGSQDGKGEVKTYQLGGAGFYEDPKWSPDSKKLSFADNSRSLYWIDLATGAVKKVSSETLYSPINTLHHAWSPDSRWLAYTRNTESNFQRAHLYSLEQDRSWSITDGLADVSEPVFDASGKYLFFFASTDAGPVREWFAMSNTDSRLSGTLYLAVLATNVPSPLAKESDEEKGKAKDESAEKKDSQKTGDSKAGSTEEEKPTDDKKVSGEGKATGDKKAADEKSGGDKKKAEVRVTVDFDGLAQRIVPLPVKTAAYWELQPGEAGKLHYLKTPEGVNPSSGSVRPSLCRFDLEKREEETLLDQVDHFILSADAKKVLVQQKSTWLIAEAKAKIDAAKGKLNLDAIQVRVDPRAEWAQIFDEAWRVNRDFFYDPGMHGADWKAIRAKYAAFLPHLACRADLNTVMQWMGSEVAVGHHYVGGGEFINEPKRVPGGLLGADYEVANGRYRFKRVLGGLNWNPQLRAPLTEPGVDVKAGDYLLAVAGQDLVPPDNLYARFENTAVKIVELTVGPDPSGKGSRVVKAVPIEDEGSLRNRDWVEGNVRKVHEATGGRVAYVYVPNTAALGFTYFKRYFYPQAQKDAIIIDERHNGGGQIADYYIDAMRKPFIAMWAMRYGPDLKTPQASIEGPKVMLIDETAGSGGDLLPWMFRKFKLGTLVGRRTWGGLVGVLGFPVLMDGAMISAPNLAFWTEDGWGVENEGVPPDTEVEQTPAEVIAGHDPQLEKAIQVVLQQLKENPPKKLLRPPYPIRVRR
jgi:tricorn protease